MNKKKIITLLLPLLAITTVGLVGCNEVGTKESPPKESPTAVTVTEVAKDKALEEKQKIYKEKLASALVTTDGFYIDKNVVLNKYYKNIDATSKNNVDKVYLEQVNELYKQINSADVDKISDNILEELRKFDYLSDFPYDKNASRVSWGVIKTNERLAGNGEPIQFYDENKQIVLFNKGFGLHANGYLEIDVPKTDKHYVALSGKIGMDESSVQGDGVEFRVKVKKVGSETFEEIYKEVCLPNKSYKSFLVELEDVERIRLETDRRAYDGSDHSEFADLKLLTQDYVDAIKTNSFYNLNDFDRIIESRFNTINDSNIDLTDPSKFDSLFKLQVLRRDLINKIGELELDRLYANKLALKGFLYVYKDLGLLEKFTLTGAPDGTYLKAFEIMGKFHEKYIEKKEVITQSEQRGNGLSKLLNTEPEWNLDGYDEELQQKMWCSIALALSENKRYWAGWEVF